MWVPTLAGKIRQGWATQKGALVEIPARLPSFSVPSHLSCGPQRAR
jgi:hypothetical protein